MSKAKIIAILVGAGLVYLVGSRVYDANQAAAPAKKKAGRVVNVDVTEARVGPIREELLLTGSLKPKETVDISPKITGRIQTIDFLVGDVVNSGDVLAELEADELRQQVMRSQASYAVGEANVAQSQAQLANAKADLDRAQLLFDQDLLSPQEFQQSQTSLQVLEAQVQLSEAQLQQAEAELNELKIRLEGSKIYSPMHAIVSERYVDPGALVNPNTPIMQVVNLSTMVTRGNVPERYVESLAVGSLAEVNVDAILGQQFEGRVARIAPVLDAATRSAVIEIDIENPRHVLKAEMFARITLDLGSTREATLIPRDGLVYRGQQPGVYVVPEQADRPIFRVIETGLTREGQVEVIANLDAGTRIVGRGATMLRDGDRITSGPGGGARGGGGTGASGGAAKKGSS
ncbi:MAG: efflux RND transporter periplasmic adaptor subunit [Bryobacterales bacterium]|nr:efflux RND transporter periplasmic adaptor subunit [Bryobacterales bacterium]